MTSEAAERFFALGFALEQLREHLFEVQRDIPPLLFPGVGDDREVGRAHFHPLRVSSKSKC